MTRFTHLYFFVKFLFFFSLCHKRGLSFRSLFFYFLCIEFFSMLSIIQFKLHRSVNRNFFCRIEEHRVHGCPWSSDESVAMPHSKMHKGRDGECGAECTECIREVAAHKRANETKFDAKISSSHPWTLRQFINAL